MQKRIFNDWLATFRPSINGYGYYTDFAKVYENAERLKIEINIFLNENIEFSHPLKAYRRRF